MNTPTITTSKIIGTFAGQPMNAWTEVAADGSERTFEEYVTTVFAPSIGRDVGLTMVRETTAA